MLVDKDMQNLLTTNSLFSGVNKDQLKSFIKPKNFIQINDGSIIYSNEEPAQEIYLVIQGEVKIKCSNRKKIVYKYITDFFGEEEIEKNQNRQSTAVANKDSILYKITSDELNNLTGGISQVNKNLNSESSESEKDSTPLSNHIPENLITETESEENESINFDEVGDDLKFSE